MTPIDEPTELQVPAGAAGGRLDSWLAARLGWSRSAAAAAIEDGRVTVDGRIRAKGLALLGGELVLVSDPPSEPPSLDDTPRASVVFADDQLLVIDKPAGLVVHPAPGHSGATLSEQLAERAAGAWEPLLVHRLDRDTSGLMVVAKTESALAALRSQLAGRELTREYVALVEGVPGSRRGTIDAPIGRDRSRRTRMSVDTDKPREAVTHFELERVIGDRSLLRVRLETGRTHQIRAHLAAIGHPVCGDRDYGAQVMPGLDRQFLHSARLGLRHPIGGERLEWQSPLPPDLASALERLSG